MDSPTDKQEQDTPVVFSKLDATEVTWRKRIIVSIILIVTFIGVPSWYLTTTIPRTELPAEQVYGLSENLHKRVNYEIPVYIDVPKPLEGLIDETQELIDSKLNQDNNIPVDFRIVLKQGQGSRDDYKLELITIESDETGGGESVYISPFEDRTTKLFLSSNVISNGLIPDFITRVLTNDLFGSEIEMLKKLSEPESILKLQFSPTYHVTISLLQGGSTPIGWDIETASKIFVNYLNTLKPIAKFLFDSQVEHYEKLSDNTELIKNEETGEFILKESDTSTFIDYSEWGLDQNSELVPSINFIIYVPDKEFSPIKIENSETNSFIVPQWGGVSIFNTEKNFLETNEDLLGIFEIFASQLFQLLGVPLEPKSPFIRIDELARIQTIKNLYNSIDNLNSLVKLVNQLPNIAIPDITSQQVKRSIELINETLLELQNGSWLKASKLSADAFILSQKAFFQKDMVQQVYFPDEHKMAVYTPLLGPFGTIVLLGLLRSFKEGRLLRKQTKEEKSE